MAIEYKIGEVADLLGTTIRTIRYYEEEGLLRPSRTDGGTRLYSERHVSRLKSILHLVENGFSLESIRLIGSVRETCKTGDESSRKVSAQLDGKLKEIAARAHELERLKKEITQAKAVVGKCRGCRNKPTSKGCPACPAKTHANSVELLNLIWDQDS
ncbi:MAG: MerR family transcriptional regulator [Gammaproteobacteria bacterium]|nr:MAG: MerR family transcriptional regulator [Gammaproteobacteria bacterium]